MAKFLRRLGYVVNSPDKKQNIVLNTIDIILTLVYIILSFVNVAISNPSILLLVINSLIMARFIVNNIIEEKRLTRLQGGIGSESMVKVYFAKIILESLTILILIYFAIWGYSVTKDLSVVKAVIRIVLIVTFFENGLRFLERLYDATPKIIS